MSPKFSKKIVIGCDHAGFKLKERIKKYLIDQGFKVEDVTPELVENDDYPDYARLVAEKVGKNNKLRGVLICGTGTGMVIAANKFKGVRAAHAYDEYTARMAREHNNANVLTLRARKFSWRKSLKILKTWLETPFSKEARHVRRLNKIKRFEEEWGK